MRHVSFITALSLVAAVALVGCAGDRAPPVPTPTSTATPVFPGGTGGPCGDGTVLRPNEQCP